MDRYDLYKRIRHAQLSLGSISDELGHLHDSPNIDENYKLEWPENQPLTTEFFDELDRLTELVSAHWDKHRP